MKSNQTRFSDTSPISFVELKETKQSKETSDFKLARPDLGSMNAWHMEKPKGGGANGAGIEGGIYVDNLENPHYRVLFKQDETAKNICEVVAGGMMRDLSDDPDAFAEVAFSLKPGVDPKTFNPDQESGENVYVASVYFNPYHDLYVDAYLADGVYPERFSPNHFVFYDDELSPVDKVKVRDQRPKLLDEDIIIKKVIRLGRYRRLAKVLAMSLFFDDPDVHTMNIGAVPDDEMDPHDEFPSKQVVMLQRNEEKSVDVYKYVKAVRLDYGGALGSKALISRHLDDKLHPDDMLTMLSGPPNYFQWYPDVVTRDIEFSRELRFINKISIEKLQYTIDKNINYAAQFYNAEALRQFAQLIGVPLKKDMVISKVALIHDIKVFMYSKLLARKQDAKLLADKIDNEMREGGRLIDSVKRAIKHVYNPNNFERSDRDAFLAAPTPGNDYNRFESFFGFRFFTILKNVLKLVTELFPALIEEISAYQANKIVKRRLANKKNHALTKIDYFQLVLLFALHVLGDLLFAIGSRITSPIRAANETYSIFFDKVREILDYTSLNKHYAYLIAKGFAWFGYGLSLLVSACLHAVLAVVASSALSTMFGATLATTAAVKTIPYLKDIGSVISAVATPIANAFNINIVEPVLAGIYAGMSFLASITLIPLRATIKSFFKEHTRKNYESTILSSYADTISKSHSPRSSLSTHAQLLNTTFSESKTELSTSRVTFATTPSDSPTVSPDTSPRLTPSLTQISLDTFSSPSLN